MFGNDQFTTVLHHYDGTNGATGIVDNAVGGPANSWGNSGCTLATAVAKFGPSSLNQPGGAWINASVNSANWALGTNDWTWDFWHARSETGTAIRNLCGVGNSGLTGGYMYFQIQATTSVVKFSLSDTFTCTASAITDTNLHHIAAVRFGNDFMVAVDGVFGSPVSITGQTFTCAGGLSVGRLGDFAGGNTAIGYTDEFRISKGIARWTANFTPPTEPYDAPANGWGWNVDHITPEIHHRHAQVMY